MELALQLFTLRDYLGTKEGFSKSLEKVSGIGFRSVELAGLGELELGEFKAIADREQLSVCGTHIGYEDLTGRLDDLIAEHHALGSKFVGTGGIPDRFRSKEGYIAFGKEISNIGKRLRSEGLSFVYHNHDFEFARYDGKTGIEWLLESTDPDSFFFELDLYWTQAAGADPAAWVRKLKDRVKIVHLKDMIITHTKERRFAEVGEGNMNYVDILKACEEAEVEWGVVEQDQCYGQDPFQCIALSLRNLTNGGLRHVSDSK